MDRDRDDGPGSYAALLEDETAVCVRSSDGILRIVLPRLDLHDSFEGVQVE